MLRDWTVQETAWQGVGGGGELGWWGGGGVERMKGGVNAGRAGEEGRRGTGRWLYWFAYLS